MRDHGSRRNIHALHPSDATPSTHSIRKELMDLAAVFVAGAAAHTLVLALGHTEFGGFVLVGVGVSLIAVVCAHRWRQQRRRAGRALEAEDPSTAEIGQPRTAGTHLWRIRVGVEDVPGGLATLTTHLARLGVNIRQVQIHPGVTESIDEFLASGPADVGVGELTAAIVRAGGNDPLIRPADIHEFSDATSRTLNLAAAVMTGGTTATQALTALTGATRVEYHADPPAHLGADDMSGSTLCLTAPHGGVLVIEREEVPFTAVEFARSRAFLAVLQAWRPSSRTDARSSGG
jgi:hypothetical protein